MKREMMSALIGVSFLFPAAADAQRVHYHGSSVRPATVVISGRLTPCRRPADPRPFDCRSRVVTYRSTPRYVVRGPGYTWVRVDPLPVRWAPVRYARYDRSLAQGELRRLLGAETFDLIRDEGRRSGLRGPLSGEWIDARGRERVLVVRMDRVEVAELTDIDGDGLVDDMYLLRGRGGHAAVALR